MSAKHIYHMVPKAEWQAQLLGRDTQYHPASLHDEGFIHCTGELERLAAVANQFYRDVAGPYVILVIDATQVAPEVRWEAADGHIFPHIYGPLDQNAVVDVFPFLRADDGTFLSLTARDYDASKLPYSER